MKKVLALIAVLSLALVGAAAETTASAQTGEPTVAEQKAGMRATVTPTRPARYAAVTSKLTGGKSRTTYYCTLTLYKAGISGGASLAYSPSITTVKTSRSGKATCRQTFVPFSGTWDGQRHYCPPTRADKRAGWKCGVGWANSNDLDQTTAALFTF